MKPHVAAKAAMRGSPTCHLAFAALQQRWLLLWPAPAPAPVLLAHGCLQAAQVHPAAPLLGVCAPLGGAGSCCGAGGFHLRGGWQAREPAAHSSGRGRTGGASAFRGICAAAACVESTTMHHAVPPTLTLRSQALLDPATPACLQVMLCVLAVAPGLWPPTQWCLASLLPMCRALMATTSRPAGAKERGRRY